MRVEDVLKGRLSFLNASRSPRDSEIYTFCPICEKRQSLGEARIARGGGETLYMCMEGCQPIVAVGLPDSGPWEGRGYRIGPYILKNAEDLFIPVTGTGNFIALPAFARDFKRP